MIIEALSNKGRSEICLLSAFTMGSTIVIRCLGIDAAPLLPIITAALNRLQPPLKHAALFFFFLLLFFLLLLLLPHKLSVSRSSRRFVSWWPLQFFFFSLFRVRLHLSPALRSRRSDRGVRRKKKKKTMVLCTLFFYLLCLCFDASAATSLITGKTSAQKEHTGRARSLDSSVSPSLGSSWNAHNSVLDVLDIQANIFETKGRQHSEFFITLLPFGINWWRRVIQLDKLAKTRGVKLDYKTVFLT